MKVYGTSDDLVELEGSKYQENEIGGRYLGNHPVEKRNGRQRCFHLL